MNPTLTDMTFLILMYAEKSLLAHNFPHFSTGKYGFKGGGKRKNSAENSANAEQQKQENRTQFSALMFYHQI